MGEPGGAVPASGVRQAPGSSAARAPADTASQPSTGQALVRTLRAELTATAPSRSRLRRAGVADPVSDHRTPPVPMSTTGPGTFSAENGRVVAEACAAGAT